MLGFLRSLFRRSRRPNPYAAETVADRRRRLMEAETDLLPPVAAQPYWPKAPSMPPRPPRVPPPSRAFGAALEPVDYQPGFYLGADDAPDLGLAILAAAALDSIPATVDAPTPREAPDAVGCFDTGDAGLTAADL